MIYLYGHGDLAFTVGVGKVPGQEDLNPLPFIAFAEREPVMAVAETEGIKTGVEATQKLIDAFDEFGTIIFATTPEALRNIGYMMSLLLTQAAETYSDDEQETVH